MHSTCAICENAFKQTKKYHVQTCSEDCAKRWRAQRMAASYAANGSWVTAHCANPDCQAEFRHRRSKPQRYCTKACYNRMVSESAQRERVCARPGCDKLMTNYARQEQQFCSVSCRNKFTASQREVNYPECKVCGISTGSYNRIYCDEHRPSRPGRKPMPRKTAICQNPECGEEFSRPGTWPGQMMFCSLQCSNAQHSRKRAQHYRFGEVNLNSSYELRFIACMARFGVKWEPWPNDRPFVHDGHEYRPDFLVNGCAVEVKGWEPEDHPQRAMRAAWNLPEPLVVIDEAKLKSLEAGDLSLLKGL